MNTEYQLINLLNGMGQLFCFLAQLKYLVLNEHPNCDKSDD